MWRSDFTELFKWVGNSFARPDAEKSRKKIKAKKYIT
jgi:hypothetical protein